jgi:hypothetical protein
MADPRTTVIPLNQGERLLLQQLTIGGTANFAAGYRAISDMLASRPGIDVDTVFFFQGAGPINANDPLSAANTFIRTVTEQGLLWDGYFVGDPSGLLSYTQGTSDKIGTGIFENIDRLGGIPTINSIIERDALTTITGSIQTIGGWGGAGRYWNIEVPNPLTNEMTTIGGMIMEKPAELEKFIALTAMGGVAAFGNEFYQLFTHPIRRWSYIEHGGGHILSKFD